VLEALNMFYAVVDKQKAQTLYKGLKAWTNTKENFKAMKYKILYDP